MTWWHVRLEGLCRNGGPKVHLDAWTRPTVVWPAGSHSYLSAQVQGLSDGHSFLPACGLGPLLLPGTWSTCWPEHWLMLHGCRLVCRASSGMRDPHSPTDMGRSWEVRAVFRPRHSCLDT